MGLSCTVFTKSTFGPAESSGGNCGRPRFKLRTQHKSANHAVHIFFRSRCSEFRAATMMKWAPLAIFKSGNCKPVPNASRCYKVITTTVIGPLDDHTYCVRFTITHLGSANVSR